MPPWLFIVCVDGVLREENVVLVRGLTKLFFSAGVALTVDSDEKLVVYEFGSLRQRKYLGYKVAADGGCERDVVHNE